MSGGDERETRETAEADRAEAERLRRAHGVNAEQHLVDLMQDALRTGDEAAAQRHDRILKSLQSKL